MTANGTAFDLQLVHLVIIMSKMKLIGKFSVYNVLASIAATTV